MYYMQFYVYISFKELTQLCYMYNKIAGIGCCTIAYDCISIYLCGDYYFKFMLI